MTQIVSVQTMILWTMLGSSNWPNWGSGRFRFKKNYGLLLVFSFQKEQQ